MVRRAERRSLLIWGVYDSAVSDRRLIVGLSGAGLAYAVVRYNVFKGVPWEQLPVYVSNKAIALVALILIGLSRVVVDTGRRKGLGLAGAGFVALHLLLSLMISGPEYFPSMYAAGGKMTGTAALSMLAGALGSGAVLWLFHSTRVARGQPTRSSLVPGLGRALLLFTAVHVALIGVSGWFDVSGWPGSLPPITLLSFVIAAALMVMPKAKRSGISSRVTGSGAASDPSREAGATTADEP